MRTKAGKETLRGLVRAAADAVDSWRRLARCRKPHTKRRATDQAASKLLALGRAVDRLRCAVETEVDAAKRRHSPK